MNDFEAFNFPTPAELRGSVSTTQSKKRDIATEQLKQTKIQNQQLLNIQLILLSILVVLVVSSIHT